MIEKTSALHFDHQIGLFGDYEGKNNLLKIKESGPNEDGDVGLVVQCVSLQFVPNLERHGEAGCQPKMNESIRMCRQVQCCAIKKQQGCDLFV